MGSDATETVAAIVAAHRAGTITPAQTVARSYQRIRDHNDPAVFISLRDEKDALAEAEALSRKDAAQLPLLGVPVAVKDNIDAQGLPTTAACPAFSYMPAQDSTAVAKLRAAGAIIIGKTNLDQFATGLVGVRSPYGIPVNPVAQRSRSRADRVRDRRSRFPPAWCRSRSAPTPQVRGRVPAMLNNIVGLKPSLGLISTAGAGAGVPDAGLRLGVLAHRRRRDDCAEGDGRPRRRRSVFARPAARRDVGASANSFGSACRAMAS